MNTEARTLPNAVIILVAITIAVGAIVAAASLGAFGSPAQATHVPPDLLAGASNDGKACADLQGSETWEEFKLEETQGNLSSGSHTDGTLTVTISNFTLGDASFDWTSNIGVDGVVVKDGVDGANFYLYDPEDTADTGLSTPGASKAISHISFCYDVEPTLTVEKVVVNDDGGTAAAGDFTLRVDGGAVTSGATNTVSAGAHVVSEDDPGDDYTTTIGGDCDASGNVTLAAGENKTCTITNDDVPPTTTTTTTTPTASPTPTTTTDVLGETQEPEALPDTGGAPEAATASYFPLLLGLVGLALLSGAGTLVALAVRRQR